MAMNMDAALRITTRVDGANGIVSLNRNLQAVGSTAKGVTGALVGLTGASAGLSGALGALAPLASIAGLVGLAKGSLDAGDKMFDLAQKTGVSVEALARFKKAASTSGTDIDAVSKALVKLSKGMVEAAATGKGKAADSLKALGLSAVDASGKLKGADQVTLEIANRFKSMADGPAKAALALNLFGKAGADMIPLLNMGGDAIDKLSVKMTTAFAEKADEYSDKLAMLSGKVGAFGADLLIALLPALNAVTDAVSGAVSAFNSLPPLLKNVAVGGALIAVAWGPLAGLIKGTTAAFIVCQGAIQGFQLQMKLAAMEGIPLLNAAIMSIPLAGWAIAAAAALAALGAALYLNNKDFKQWADTSLNFIKVLASDGIGTMRSFGAWLGQMWNGLVKGAQKIGASIGQAFSGPFGVIGQVAQSVFDFVGQKIQGIWNMLPEGLRKSIGSVGSYFQGAWSKAAGMTATGGQGAAAGAATSADGFTPDMAALAGAGVGKEKKPDAFKLSSQGKALVAAAQKLGVSPLDLATIIGFETGGSYSPSQRGGDGGNYMGLIQFGPTERRQYGASPNQSFEEQVQGPVVRYFQDRFKGVGMSTQGADLLTLYRTVLGGNPKANINGQDAFGTSPASGVARMAPNRQESLRRFFGGKAENVGYDSAAAGADAAQGFDAAQKQAEQVAKQLQAAKELVQTKEAAFELANATAPLEKLSLEFDNERTKRMQEYVNKLQEAKSEEERLLLVQSQAFDIRSSEISYQERLLKITSDQLDLERERAVLLADSMARMEEMSTRSSIGAGAQQGIQSYVDSLGNLRDAVGQLTVNGIGGLEDSLTELATTGTTNFREFAASILKDTSRMIIRQLVLKSIMQIIGGIGGSGVAKTFEMPNAAFIPSGGYAFANGGIIDKPTVFPFAKGIGLMGEAGPEAIMPLRRGRDGRLGVAGGGGGDTTINVSVDAKGTNVQGDGSQSASLARVIAQAVQTEMVKQKRPGGLLAS